MTTVTDTRLVIEIAATLPYANWRIAVFGGTKPDPFNRYLNDDTWQWEQLGQPGGDQELGGVVPTAVLGKFVGSYLLDPVVMAAESLPAGSYDVYRWNLQLQLPNGYWENVKTLFELHGQRT